MPRTGEFSFFALQSAPEGAAGTADVDQNGQPRRKRRMHLKSRAGCIPCKTRRIKCDEGRPICSTCTRRGQECSYEVLWPTARKSTSSKSSSDSSASSKISKKKDKGPSDKDLQSAAQNVIFNPPDIKAVRLDLDVMKLLHHFETYTCETLVFGPDIWRRQAMPLALQNEYLMHAILLLAASHLRYLSRSISAARELEAYHLALTLRGFRGDINNISNASCEDVDVRMGCSLLLLHHAWSVPYSPFSQSSSQELSSPEEYLSNPPVDVGADNLMTFSVGMRVVVQSGWHAREGSIFHDTIAAGTYKRFMDWCNEADSCTFDFNTFFPNHLPSTLLGISSETEGWSVVDPCFIPGIIERVIPILHAVEALKHGTEILKMQPDLCTYVMMSVGKFTDEFRIAAGNNDKEALLVMLCFYASADILLSDYFWWITERARFMCKAIVQRLENEREDKEFDGSVEKVCAYFGFDRGNVLEDLPAPGE